MWRIFALSTKWKWVLCGIIDNTSFKYVKNIRGPDQCLKSHCWFYGWPGGEVAYVNGLTMWGQAR